QISGRLRLNCWEAELVRLHGSELSRVQLRNKSAVTNHSVVKSPCRSGPFPGTMRGMNLSLRLPARGMAYGRGSIQSSEGDREPGPGRIFLYAHQSKAASFSSFTVAYEQGVDPHDGDGKRPVGPDVQRLARRADQHLAVCPGQPGRRPRCRPGNL